jgi:hypothetical protein
MTSQPSGHKGCSHLWLSRWMGWDQSKKQEDCPPCPYCDIERLSTGVEEICQQRATSPLTRARLRHLTAGVNWRKAK